VTRSASAGWVAAAAGAEWRRQAVVYQICPHRYGDLPGGWRSVTNFGARPVPLPQGTVVMSSAALEADLLPADTTAWIISGS
jgi:hypothetical protein